MAAGDGVVLFQAQLDARRRRLETENTAPLVTTDTQINAIKAAVVDKNCNATSVEQGKN